MTNKIRGYSPSEPIVPVQSTHNGGTVGDKNGAPPAAPSGSQPIDQVTLTSSARSLQKIEAAISNTPVVNSGKVATVKQQLSAGTYQIKPGRVAAKLLQSDSELQ